MTQQQIAQEFKSYPKAQKSVIRTLLRIFEEDLDVAAKNDELSIEERIAIVESLSQVEGKTPPTDKQVKEDYANYLSEKYK